jgi:serine O-acetyltransferase
VKKEKIDVNISEVLTDTISKLSEYKSYKSVYDIPTCEIAMPHYETLREIVQLLRQIIFPGYFGASNITTNTIHFYTGVNIDKVHKLLSEQIMRGLCFECVEKHEKVCNDCTLLASEFSAKFISQLPFLRELLSTDVQAVFDGDPAAKSKGEVIYCYPAIRAITNYRIAHELLLIDIPLIPRIITELAHSETGIDIHPGATIGKYFAIDHGTGVVIGETTVIGNHVKIYQGVTLGAKSFPTDDNGNPIKGIPRHPVVEDNVVIYAEATILGRITIGKNSVIGGNMWITNDIPADTKIILNK